MSLRKAATSSIRPTGASPERWRFFFTKTKYFELYASEFKQAEEQRGTSGVARIGCDSTTCPRASENSDIACDGDRVLWWTNSGFFWAAADMSNPSVMREVPIKRGGFGLSNRIKFYYERYRWFALSESAYRCAQDQVENAVPYRIGCNSPNCGARSGAPGINATCEERDQCGIDCDGSRVLWWAESGLYWAAFELSHEDVELLVWNRQRKQESQLQRLRKIRAREEELDNARRERIPDEVRAFVWERDEGRCTKCGAQQELQFDHVIPVAKGGGNSIDNIQILCGNCNRQKSDHIV